MSKRVQLSALAISLALLGAGVPAAGEESQGTPPSSTSATPAAPPPDTQAARRRDGRHSVEVSYFGYNFTWPGVVVGYSFRAVESPRRLHALVVGADLGTYVWPRHDVGLFVMPRLGWRGRHKSGFQGEVHFALGYLHSFVSDESFGVVDGKVVSNGRPGYPMLLFGPSAGIGWFIARWGVTPFARVGALFEYPNFDALLTRFQVSAGVEVRL